MGQALFFLLRLARDSGLSIMAVVAVPGAAEKTVDNTGLILKPSGGACLELPAGKAATDVFVTFAPPAEDPTASAPSRGFAFWIEAADQSGKMGQLNHLSSVPSEAYALRNIPAGSFRVRAALWCSGKPGVTPSSASELLQAATGFEVKREAAVEFQVRSFEDFSPTYEWQPVQQWHRVPVGLEVALDLATGGRRARIPSSWQWDAAIDVGEKRKMRVAVEAADSLGILLQKLGLDPSLYEAVWRDPDGKFERTLDASWTAQQSNLFGYQKDISIRQRQVPASP